MALRDLCHRAAGETGDGVLQWNPAEDNYWWRPKDDGPFPDSSQFQPGDIVLFRPLNPDFLQKRIISHQERFCRDWKCSDEHARYTHAAVYLGYDGLLCEAVWPRAQFSSIDEKIEDNCIRIRRVLSLTEQQRKELAEAAASLRNVRYGWKTLVELRFTKDTLKRRLPDVEDESEQRSLICSTLCSHALKRVGVCVLPPDQRITVPAYLSLTGELSDVAVEWRRFTRVLPSRPGSAGMAPGPEGNS